jgi:predicted Zn-dependent peptidase
MTSTLLPKHSLNTPTIHQLPNGLTIVAESMPSTAVNLNIWVNVGAAIESPAIEGMAHFLEHMIFKGTPRLAVGEFERLVEERGAMTNAATSQDYTHYYITTAPQDFAALAPLQIDVVTNPLIPDREFETERQVVLEEIRRSCDRPQRRIYQQSMEVGFERLPYRRAVLGSEEVISQLTPQQMRYFHATHYQPKRTTAVVVGNLPVDELINIVADGFMAQGGSMPGLEVLGKTSAPTLEAPFDRVVRREYTDSTLQQARLIMMWRVPGAIELEETYPLDILAAILGSGRTSRLVQELREERQLVNGISVSNLTHRLQGLFYLSANLPTANIPEVEQIITDRIPELQQSPVTPAEINRVRRQVANRYIFGTETPSDRAHLYGYYRSVVGDLSVALNYPQTIQSIDADTLQLAAQKYLSPTAYGALIVKPE